MVAVQPFKLSIALINSDEDSQRASVSLAAVVDSGPKDIRRSLSCYKCGEVGHVRRNYPQCGSTGSGHEQPQQQGSGGSQNYILSPQKLRPLSTHDQ